MIFKSTKTDFPVLLGIKNRSDFVFTGNFANSIDNHSCKAKIVQYKSYKNPSINLGYCVDSYYNMMHFQTRNMIDFNINVRYNILKSIDEDLDHPSLLAISKIDEINYYRSLNPSERIAYIKGSLDEFIESEF